MAKKWIWGNRKAGYRLITLKRKKDKYGVEIWQKNRIVRLDYFDIKTEAIKWARQRKKYYYG